MIHEAACPPSWKGELGLSSRVPVPDDSEWRTPPRGDRDSKPCAWRQSPPPPPPPPLKASTLPFRRLYLRLSSLTLFSTRRRRPPTARRRPAGLTTTRTPCRPSPVPRGRAAPVPIALRSALFLGLMVTSPFESFEIMNSHYSLIIKLSSDSDWRQHFCLQFCNVFS